MEIVFELLWSEVVKLEEAFCRIVGLMIDRGVTASKWRETKLTMWTCLLGLVVSDLWMKYRFWQVRNWDVSNSRHSEKFELHIEHGNKKESTELKARSMWSIEAKRCVVMFWCFGKYIQTFCKIKIKRVEIFNSETDKQRCREDVKRVPIGS